jgi:hypothetical protein
MNNRKKSFMHTTCLSIFAGQGDSSGIESFDMQRMKLNQKSCERILYEFAGHVANSMKLGLFEEAAFSHLLTTWNLHMKLIFRTHI